MNMKATSLYSVIILTVRNEDCEGYVFTGVCLSTGGGGRVPAWSWGGLPAWSWGGLLPGGGWSRGLVPGPGAPGPGGCLMQTPPEERWLLLRTVRILLECILVYNSIYYSDQTEANFAWK